MTSRSIDHKKAASVFPLPVGAQISVCSPPAMGGQPPILGRGRVGEGRANQARTAGEKASSTWMISDGSEATEGVSWSTSARLTPRFPF